MDDQEYIIQQEFEANYFTDELSDEALDRTSQAGDLLLASYGMCNKTCFCGG